MHPRSSLAAVAVACAAAVALPAAASAATHSASSETAVLINLKHPAGLAAFVRAVSDPASPRYRDYATVEELTQRFGARRGDSGRTVRYLRSHGLRAKVGPGATWVLAHGSAADVTQAFPSAGARIASADGRLAVPAALRGAVSSAGVLDTGSPTAKAAADDPYNGLSPEHGSAVVHSGTASGCPEGVNAPSPGGSGFTPNQLSAAYGLDVLHNAGFKGEGMHAALVEMGGFNRSDIETFARCFGITMPKLTATNIAGGELLPALDETTLDIEVMLGQMPKLSRLDVYESAHPGITDESDLLDATAAALGTKGRHPDVISISYGLCEPLLIGSIGTIGTAHAMDSIMQIAAGSGVSVTASTGDTGYTGCERDVPSVIPAVALPSTLPHVTAVGGTNLTLSDDNHIVRETAWNDAPLGVAGGGGGGHSLLFSAPWWQHAPGTEGHDRSVPDVSALADVAPGYVVYCTAPGPGCQNESLPNGGWQTFGGTSAATPLVASGLALIDQAAKKRHQAPIGFANPLLYGLARGKNPGFVINDITIGTNDITAVVPPQAGGGSPAGIYKAKKGYDQATGLGSLKFGALNLLSQRTAR